MIEITKILKGNRITLPKKMMDNAKLKEGDYIGYKFGLTGKGIEVFPVKFQEKIDQ